MENASTENVRNAIAQEIYSRQKDTLSILEMNGLKRIVMENSMICRRSIRMIAGAKFDIEKIATLGNKMHSKMVNTIT